MTTQKTTETVEVPADACRLRSGVAQCTIDKLAKDDSGKLKPVPIKMLARTAGAIEHPFWFGGKVIHDMEGMTLHKDVIAVDYRHDEEIGYLDKFEASSKLGLTVEGALVPTSSSDDRATKVAERAAGGVPYEASIDFNGPMLVEYVEEGVSVDVNGQVFEGPGSVVREWVLRGVATCPYGADMDTSTQFKDDKPIVAMVTKLTAQSEPPVEQDDPTEPKDNPSSQDNSSMSEENTDQQVDNNVDESTSKESQEQSGPMGQQDESVSELKRFTDAFGKERGAGYLLEGTSFEDAQTKELSALREENAKLKQRLSGKDAVEEEGEGETEPAGFSSAGEKGLKKKGFASKLTIPG